MIVSWPPLISACQSHLTGDKSGEKNWLLQGGPLVICKDWVILYLSRTYGDTRSVHLKHGFLSAAAGLKCVSSVSPFSFLFVKSNDMAEGRQVDIGTQSCRASFDDCNLDVGCQWRLPPEDEHGGQQQQLQRTLIIGNVTWRWRAATQTHEILETVYVLSKRDLELLHFNVYILCC